ncbi:MAG: helix-turn-helix transcriptional regulator [Clostridia bacterium]|nr:helix-turn-helix transcriptional regulator [Clostridia bacterium]
MKSDIFATSAFPVVFAERRRVGDEWNKIIWDRHHKDIMCHRLYLPMSGSGKLTLSHAEIELKPGNLYFLPAFSVMKSSIETEIDKYYIHFRSSLTILEMYGYLSRRYSVAADESTVALVDTVLKNYTDRSVSASMKVAGAMSILLSDFLDGIGASEANMPKFQSVLDYIDGHYTENIKLDTLAEIMNISTMYFSNAFKSTFNISPKQYILNKRLAKSQQLLIESELSIKDIAYAVGFENENYFSEFFSSKMGISALKFRNRKINRERESIL